MATNSKSDFSRPLVDIPPSLLILVPEFGSLSPNDSEYKSYTEQVNLLVVEVNDMLIASKSSVLETLKLIDLLCRLGVSYHFENKIEAQLDQMFHAKVVDDFDWNLCSTALMFRVFRQHGYKISCNVFNKFKGNDGKFNDNLKSDVHGLLSLYEATYLSLNEEEDVFDEALSYTTMHLKTLLASQYCSPRMADHIAHALEQSFHRGIPRIESRQYISFYEKDEWCNEIVLKLAKLDFNRLQILHQQEINEVLRWHKQQKITDNLPYSRDRPIEAYMWAHGTFFEPKYTAVRTFFGKYNVIITHSDDVYDAYGSIEELRILTSAIQRWNNENMDQTPDCIQFLCKCFLDVFHERETMLQKEGKSSNLSYAIDAVKEQLCYYQTEAEWLNNDITPEFGEYLNNAELSTWIHALAMLVFTQLEIVGYKELEWLKGFPKLDRAAMTICRLMDDLVTVEREQKRKHIPTAIECYMKTYSVSQKVAIEALQGMIEKAWKDINEGFMKPTIVPRDLLMIFLNFSRVMDFLYKHEDIYTHPEKLKDCAKSLFIDPIPIYA